MIMQIQHPKTPIPGRPEGVIEVIRQLSATENKDTAAFSFEKSVIKKEVVRVGNQFYFRLTDYDCSAGANGRPLYALFEYYHALSAEAVCLISSGSEPWPDKKKADYLYEDHGTGVLF